MDLLWRTALERIQGRFHAITLQSTPLKACIIHTVAPRQSDDHSFPPDFVYDTPCAMHGSALSLEPIMRGVPSGNGIEMRAGFFRRVNFYARTPNLFSVYQRCASDTGTCYSGFSAAIRAAIWRGVPPGTRLRTNNPCELWTDLLFELAWQKLPGTSLIATPPSAWTGNTSIVVDHIGRFANLGIGDVQFTNPPERWYSVIDDVFSSSVAAIDVLLSLRNDDGELNQTSGVAPKIPDSDAPHPAVEGAEKSNAPVILNGQGKPVHVFGIAKPPLTLPQYNVIQSLLEAGDAGLGKDRLVQASGHSDARGILTRLAKADADWARAILMPGKPNGRYRIRTESR